MSAILYLYKCRIVNWVKQSLHKPARLILILLIVSSAVGMLLIPFPDSPVPEGEIDFSLFRLDRIGAIGFWVLAIIIVFSAVFSGAKNGAIMFTLADVHFIFPGPFRPQNVLLYGMLNMLATVLFSLIFLIYQWPNLRSTGISRGQFVLALFLFVFGVLATQLIQQMVYLFTSEHPRIRPVIRYGILTLVVLILAASAYWIFVGDGSFVKFTDLLLNKGLLYGVPYIGWLVQLWLGALTGFSWHTLFSFLLLVLAVGLGMFYSYRIEPDFYEDAINATIKRTEVEARQKAGRTNVYVERKPKVRKTGLGGGFGENAIFFLHLKEQRRTRAFFISFPMILFTFFGGLTAFIAYDEKNGNLASYLFIGIVGFTMFFFALDNPLLTDLQHPLYYYMPGKHIKKVLWSSLTPVLSMAVDLFPAFVILAILAPAPFYMILLTYLATVSIYLIYLSGQMITYMIMGSIQGTFPTMIALTLTFLLLIPTVAGLLVGGVAGEMFGVLWYSLAMLLVVCVNVGIFLLAALAGKKQLERGLNE